MESLLRQIEERIGAEGKAVALVSAAGFLFYTCSKLFEVRNHKEKSPKRKAWGGQNWHLLQIKNQNQN